MSNEKNLLLYDEQVRQKIRRMAFEIYENNFEEERIILAGLDPMGYRLAELLQQNLQEVSPLEVLLIRVKLDKTAPLQSAVELDKDVASLAKQVVVIVDDVFNTGRTLAYSFKPFLEIPVKKLQVAVLVDRGHHSFPVQPDYVGYSLSTTINEHIEVNLMDEEGHVVYLY